MAGILVEHPVEDPNCSTTPLRLPTHLKRRALFLPAPTRLTPLAKIIGCLQISEITLTRLRVAANPFGHSLQIVGLRKIFGRERGPNLIEGAALLDPLAQGGPADGRLIDLERYNARVSHGDTQSGKLSLNRRIRAYDDAMDDLHDRSAATIAGSSPASKSSRVMPSSQSSCIEQQRQPQYDERQDKRCRGDDERWSLHGTTNPITAVSKMNPARGRGGKTKPNGRSPSLVVSRTLQDPQRRRQRFTSTRRPRCPSSPAGWMHRWSKTAKSQTL